MNVERRVLINGNAAKRVGEPNAQHGTELFQNAVEPRLMYVVLGDTVLHCFRVPVSNSSTIEPVHVRPPGDK